MTTQTSHVPSGIEAPWTAAEKAAGEAFTDTMVKLNVDVPGSWIRGGGPGKLMRCIRAALMAAEEHQRGQ